MIAAGRTALVLLAAGLSERFGVADKLTQDLHGIPLALHAVAALAGIPFLARIAVTSGTALDLAAHGYRVVHNDRPEDGMSGSLRLGVAAAQKAGAEAVLIALADMPRITEGHVLRLLDGAAGPGTVIASSDGIRRSPPAIFGADHFDTLLALHGDAGARTLIAGGRQVIVPPDELLDIDRPDDLEKLRAARL